MIKFEDLPSKSTPLNAANLNTNFDELKSDIANVVESGSNSNGHWVKFADGTMICRNRINLGQHNIQNPWGVFFESEQLNLGDYPQPFIEIPTVELLPLNAFFIEKTGNGIDITNTNWGKIYAVRPNTYEGLNILVDAIAIGRWK